ncbi:MAG: transcriptional repressor LexA [Candidatus Pacebacteria bacterium]|nr:transcriptional repressor LexA [Candidatus Paceibacterota bacterium]
MLTYKQAELLRFLDDYLRREGVCPSFDEMKDALEVKSKSGVHRLLESLEERGFIRRLKHRARAIEVIRLAEDVVLPRGTRGTRGPRRPTLVSDESNPQSGATREGVFPILGSIAAGTPIEAVVSGGDNDGLRLPLSSLGSGEHFVLTVKGDSMIEAGIFDGDQAVLRVSQTAETGQIVAALVDDQDVTLKRLRRRGSAIALEPANGLHKTQIYGADRVKIQGVLVTLIRKY